MPISTIFTALFYPYIAQERTAQSVILSVRSERFALSLKERHRSQNEGSLKSEERKSDFKERCAQLWKWVPKCAEFYSHSKYEDEIEKKCTNEELSKKKLPKKKFLEKAGKHCTID